MGSTSITNDTANAGGTIIHNGGGELSAVGVCWSTTDPPTIADNYATTEIDTGSFSVELSYLYSETSYYVRAYATNEKGTGYGNSVSFTTAPALVTDIDGNVYQTIKIGNQVWMAENLKVTHYRDGTAITNVTASVAWSFLSTGAYCIYNNSVYNEVDTYGALYNWYAVDDSRNIAPEGWHVATDDEWKDMEMALGMSQSEADVYGWRGTNEGSKLAGNADLWNSGDLEDNSEFGTSGFTALPGGSRNFFNSFYTGMGFFGFFWSATEDSSNYAWSRTLSYLGSGVNRYHKYMRSGFSVRCLRD